MRKKDCNFSRQEVIEGNNMIKEKLQKDETFNKGQMKIYE